MARTQARCPHESRSRRRRFRSTFHRFETQPNTGHRRTIRRPSTAFLYFQAEQHTLRNGYSLFKSIETLHNQLETVHTADENRIFTKLLAQYQQQLKSCENNYLDVLSTLRQMQTSRNRFDHGYDEILQCIEQQRTSFEQLIDNNQHIVPDNLPQHIQMLKALQKETETNIDSMIRTLRQTTKPSADTENKLQQLILENEQLKRTMLVSDEQRTTNLPFRLAE